jgi:hypothetical protein
MSGPLQYLTINPLQANSFVAWYFLKKPHLLIKSHSGAISISFYINNAPKISRRGGGLDRRIFRDSFLILASNILHYNTLGRRIYASG